MSAEQKSLVKEPAPSEWTSQLRRGVHEPNYGYEIVTTLETFGPLAAGENTVYPLLRRLKTDRHLETFAVESPAGPARQYYRLTAQGRQRLAALEHEWGALVGAVGRCLKKGVTA